MPRADPLPPPFDDRPFTVSDARARGITASRMRASDLVAPTRGVRARPVATVPAPDGETASARMIRLRADLIERAERFAPALTPDQFISHESGLALFGAPLPFTTKSTRTLHISARRPAAQPRRSGVVGHRLQTRQPARATAQGLPVEHPARMWRQAGETWDLDDLIAAGDFLILARNRLCTIDELRREVDEAGDLRGHLLSRALAEIRPGSETPEETRVRLILVRAGLPEPELNVNIYGASGRFVARLDAAYPHYRVCVEHDGRTHAFDDRQFARDADRWDEIRALGWNHVRILSHHLRPDPQRAIDRVADALIAAGWRPGRR